MSKIYSMGDVEILMNLARARGLANSLADPVAPLAQARVEGIQTVAAEIEGLLDSVSEMLVDALGEQRG
jgi:hypothetical protein